MPAVRSSGAWSRIWAIVGREFVERVRSGWFVVGTILGPALMLALISLPLLVTQPPPDPHRGLVVIDTAAGQAGTWLIGSLDRAGLAAGRLSVSPADLRRVTDSLTEEVARGRIDGFLVAGGWSAAAGGVESVFVGFGLWFLLYASIMLYGVQVMTSVVEEKTTRLAEVLFTSVTPFQALTGKIAGIGVVGLLQMAIWAVGARLLLAAAGIGLPALTLSLLALALGYFLLGFVLYAALFGAVGAVVSSDAEARQAQIPVIVLLMVPSALMVGILAEPDGTLARVLSLVPFTSPIAMPVRLAAGGGSGGETAASLALVTLTVIALIWMAGRVYRMGMLVHGRRARAKEVVNWLTGRRIDA